MRYIGAGHQDWSTLEGRGGHQLRVLVAYCADHRDLFHICSVLRDRARVFCLLHEHEDGHEYVHDGYEYGDHQLCDGEGVELMDQLRTHDAFLCCDGGLQCLSVSHRIPSQRRYDSRRYF